MGLNYTINHVREKYLVVHVRRQVKKVMRECFECVNHLDQSQLTSKWRRYRRLDCSNPPDLLRAVQLNFGGPFLPKQGRGRVRAKRYLCLFLCLKTHYCHLRDGVVFGH